MLGAIEAQSVVVYMLSATQEALFEYQVVAASATYGEALCSAATFVFNAGCFYYIKYTTAASAALQAS